MLGLWTAFICTRVKLRSLCSNYSPNARRLKDNERRLLPDVESVK